MSPNILFFITSINVLKVHLRQAKTISTPMFAQWGTTLWKSILIKIYVIKCLYKNKIKKFIKYDELSIKTRKMSVKVNEFVG